MQPHKLGSKVCGSKPELATNIGFMVKGWHGQRINLGAGYDFEILGNHLLKNLFFEIFCTGIRG